MQGEPTQTQMGDGIILIEPEMIEHSNTRRTWKGPHKIALMKQSIVEKVYERYTSTKKRPQRWESLGVNLSTGEHSKFFTGMDERFIQEKCNSLLKEYSAKDWAKMSRGFSKANATAELEELKSLCSEYLKFEKEDKHIFEMNSKTAVSVEKEVSGQQQPPSIKEKSAELKRETKPLEVLLWMHLCM